MSGVAVVAPVALLFNNGDVAVKSSVELVLPFRVATVSCMLGGRSRFGIDSKSRLALSSALLTFSLFSRNSVAEVTSVLILLSLLAWRGIQTPMVVPNHSYTNFSSTVLTIL